MLGNVIPFPTPKQADTPLGAHQSEIMAYLAKGDFDGAYKRLDKMCRECNLEPQAVIMNLLAIMLENSQALAMELTARLVEAQAEGTAYRFDITAWDAKMQ